MAHGALLLLIAVLALTGCGGGDDEPAGPLPTARFAIPSGAATSTPASPKASPSTPAGSVIDAVSEIEPAEDTPAARKAFTRGMTDYCTTYYTLLAKAEEANPQLDSASDSVFEKAAAEASAEAERRLESLRPPPDLVAPFKDFVKVSHKITNAHEAMAQSYVSHRKAGAGGAAYDRAVVARRPLATALDATICDGKLPPAQAAAVIDVVRTVDDEPRIRRGLPRPGHSGLPPVHLGGLPRSGGGLHRDA